MGNLFAAFHGSVGVHEIYVDGTAVLPAGIVRICSHSQVGYAVLVQIPHGSDRRAESARVKAHRVVNAEDNNLRASRARFARFKDGGRIIFHFAISDWSA